MQSVTTFSQTSQTSVVSQEIAQLTIADVEALASRLEDDHYTSPFAALEDWHRLRAIAFQRPELAEPYLHLLDLEAYDES